MDLPQVCGELGLLVAAAGHVPMWVYDFAPGLQAAGGLAFDGSARAAAALAARLLLEDQTAQLHLHAIDLVCLRRGDGRQQTGNRVEGAVGVVAGEAVLVRPLVALVADFADEAALGTAQYSAEYVVPRFPHQLEECGYIPLIDGLVGQVWIIDKAPDGVHVYATGLDFVLHLALDKWAKPVLEEFKGLADAFLIGNGHVLFLNKLIVLTVQVGQSICGERDFLQCISGFLLGGRYNNSGHQKPVPKTNAEGGSECLQGVCPNARLRQLHGPAYAYL